MELKGEGYIPTYIRTDLTDELHEKFNFRTDTQIVGSTKMKKIIKQTKSRKSTHFLVQYHNRESPVSQRYSRFFRF